MGVGWDPKNENSTKFQKSARRGRISRMIVNKFVEFIVHFTMDQLLKCGWIHSRDSGIMGV